MLHYYHYSYYLRQGLMYRRIPDPPASTYRVLRLQVYMTMPCICDARDITMPCVRGARDWTHPHFSPHCSNFVAVRQALLSSYMPSPHHFILLSWGIEEMLRSTLVWSLGFLPKPPGHLYAELLQWLPFSFV